MDAGLATAFPVGYDFVIWMRFISQEVTLWMHQVEHERQDAIGDVTALQPLTSEIEPETSIRRGASIMSIRTHPVLIPPLPNFLLGRWLDWINVLIGAQAATVINLGIIPGGHPRPLKVLFGVAFRRCSRIRVKTLCLMDLRRKGKDSLLLTSRRNNTRGSESGTHYLLSHPWMPLTRHETPL